MRLFIRFLFLSFWIVELTSCTIGNGTICGPQTPKFYCDKDAYEKIMNPTTYGEHWVMVGMTKERWRQDWVSCGGMRDGGYASEAPDGSTTEVLQADSKRVSKNLGACMQSKGYEYQSNVAQPKGGEN